MTLLTFSSSPGCGQWACNVCNNDPINGHLLYPSCEDALIGRNELHHLLEQSEQAKTIALELAKHTVTESKLIVLDTFKVTLQPQLSAIPESGENLPHPKRRRPHKPRFCECSELECQLEHETFFGHQCCDWIEKPKNHWCVSPIVSVEVIEGISMNRCKYGLHRSCINGIVPLKYCERPEANAFRKECDLH
jgi:hypothetical protein